jgi:polyhydroxyalkanoate synthesis repressor PhaR
METQRILIKKYENRRLYDATNSRYVNLDEVALLVQQGHDVQVIDAASGEDITRVVLTQIIAEGAKTSESNFPLDILRQMIIASGRATQESAVHYTKAMLDLYESTYRAMVPALKPFEFMQGARPDVPSKEQPKDAGGTKAPTEELAAMRQRLADLERKMETLDSQRAGSLKSGGKARKRGPKSRVK